MSDDADPESYRINMIDDLAQLIHENQDDYYDRQMAWSDAWVAARIAVHGGYRRVPDLTARAEKAEADLAVAVKWLRTATDGFSWALCEHMDVQFCGRSMGDDAATLRRLLTEDR